MDVLSQLRQKFDGLDNFIFGHAVGGVPGTAHAKRIAGTPEWIYNDSEIRDMISKVFPKWRTSEKQKLSATRWMGIIHNYFRRGLTSLATAEEMRMPHGNVRKLIWRIKKAHTGKARGRPKKNSGTLQASNEETGKANRPLEM